MGMGMGMGMGMDKSEDGKMRLARWQSQSQLIHSKEYGMFQIALRNFTNCGLVSWLDLGLLYSLCIAVSASALEGVATSEFQAPTSF